MAMPPMNQVGGVGIGDRDPPTDLVALLQRVQELVFLHRFGGRPEGKLCGGGKRESEQQKDGGAERPEI